MKIDNSTKNVGSLQSPSGGRTAGVRTGATGAGKASPPTGQSATVVSASLLAVSGSEAAFNSQKVSEIRQAISEGRFQINPERIADGLINSVREMLDQNRHTA